jgi:putative ABC transport system permease protein
MATLLSPAARSRIVTFVDSLLAEATLSIHLEREARADFIAHLEADAARALNAGLPEAQAVESAIRAFGAVTDVRGALYRAAATSRPRGLERIRLAGEAFLRELGDARRTLWRQRLTTATAIVTVALGVGITAATYAVFDWVVLRPLPYPASHALIRVFTAGTNPATPAADLNYSEFQRFSAVPSFGPSYAYSAVTRVLSASGLDPAHIVIARVTADPLGTLGIAAREGRGFTPEEIASGGQYAIVSERLWRALGSAPTEGMVPVTIDDAPYRVVGVMPSGRGYPQDADLWRPITSDEREDDDRELVMIARLADGAAIATANGELAVTARHTSDTARTAWAEAVQRADLREVRGALEVLLALSGLILLIACANAAALMGQRTAERRKELATRAALGASRVQLVRPLLIEHLVFAAIAAAGGILIGQWALPALTSLAPAGIPRLDEVRLDGRILVVGIAAWAVVAAAMGVGRAARFSRVRLREVMDFLSSTGGASSRRNARAMVTLQAAMAVVLIVLAGSLGRTLQRLVTVDHGFMPDHLLAVNLYMRGGIGGDPRQLFPLLIDAARAVPGVSSAAVALQRPTELRGLRAQVTPADDATRPRPIVIRPVTPSYFATIGMPLRLGRAFTRDDRAGAPPVAVVNESFVRDVLRGAPALGSRLVADLVDDPLTIVGVAADATPAGEVDRAALYVALDQFPVAGGVLLVRTIGPPSTVLAALRTSIHAAAPSLPLDRIAVVSDSLAEGRAVTRFLTQLASAFGMFALLLAVVGVYGLTSTELAARWRELAIRQALGAPLAHVVWQTVRPGTAALAAGVVVGGICAIGAERWLAAILKTVAAADPVTLVAVPFVLVGVGLATALVAGRRMLTTNPAATLRGD